MKKRGIEKFIFLLLFGIFIINYTSAFSGSGSGTSASPFNITNCTQLQEMRENRTAYYNLGLSLDCIDTVGWNSGAGFAPIGNSTAGITFTGTFDGQNFTVSNLFISRGSISNIGLFGYLGLGGIIRNVGLANVSLTGSSYVGAVVGYSQGAVINSFSEGRVSGAAYVGGLVGTQTTGASISKSYSTCTVTGTTSNTWAGGLAGNGGSGMAIHDSYATGNVTGVNYVGGLTGQYGSTARCYATGRVLTTSSSNPGSTNPGGLTGANGVGTYSAWDVETSGAWTSSGASGKNTTQMRTQTTYNPGLDVSWDFTNTWIVNESINNGYPALRGLLYSYPLQTIRTERVYETNYTAANLSGTLVTLNADTNVSFQYRVRGASTWSNTTKQLLSSTSAYNLTLTGLATRTIYEYRAMAEWESNISYGDMMEFETFFAGGAGTYYSPYNISTIYELQEIEKHGEKYFNLINDIDASPTNPSSSNYNSTEWPSTTGFRSIGEMKGIFDGNNFTISNLYINRPSTSYIGLFNFSHYWAILRNVGVDNASIVGSRYSGALLGYNYGTVTNTFSTGTVSGTDYVGGLIGSNAAAVLVSKSYSTCTVVGTTSNTYAGGLIGYGGSGMAIQDSYATGNVTGVNYVGGLTGQYGTATRCYATGKITNTSATGIGGLIGGNGAGSNSFWDNQTSNKSTSSTGTGKTTTQMKDISTFNSTWTISTAWNSTAVWSIDSTGGINNGYPYLWSQTANNRIVPNATIVSHSTSAYSNVASQNFTVNLTDNYGLVNTTLTIYNSTGIYNQTTTAISTILIYPWITSSQVGTEIDFGTSQGIYTYNYQVYDISGNSYTTNNYTFTYLLDVPNMSFSGVPDNGSVLSQKYIFANVSLNTSYEKNITFTLYNSEMGVLKTYSRSATPLPRSYHFNRSDPVLDSPLNVGGDFYYQVEVYDLGGNYNTTEIRKITLDTSLVSELLITPINNFFSSIGDVLFNSTFTDNLGISAVTLNIFNSNGSLYNQTTLNVGGSLIYSAAIVVSLVEGIYNWFWSVDVLSGFDLDTTNRTITADFSAPIIYILYPADTQNYSTAITTLNYSVNETNQGYCWYSTNNGTTNSTRSISGNNFSGLTNIEGNNYWTIYCNDSAGNIGNSVTSFYVDTINPIVNSVIFTPNSTDAVDPDVNLTFSVNVSDLYSGVGNVVLEVYDEITYVNYSASLVSGNIHSGIWESNLTLNSSERNYSVNVIVEDVFGNGDYNYSLTFSSMWDCTFDLSPVTLGTMVGWDGLASAGNITILNTGDSAHSSGCSLNVQLSSSLGCSGGVCRVRYNGLNVATKDEYTILPETNRTINVSVLFLDAVAEESLKITATDLNIISSTATRNISGTIVSVTGQPYLSVSPGSDSEDILEVYLIPGQTNISAILKNIAYNATNPNTTAFDVSANWILPTGFVAIEDTNIFLQNISNSSENHFNLTLDFDYLSNLPGLLPGTAQVDFVANGYNLSDEQIIHYNGSINRSLENKILLNLICPANATQETETATACKPGNTTIITIETPGAGGGGGGGSGGGGTTERSEATYEITRGEGQGFDLEILNKLNYPKRNLNISVKGISSNYISLEPSTIESLASNSSKKIRVKITAPSYFTQAKYLLEFKIVGEVIGNQSTANPFTETRYVTLFIVDISRNETDLLINNSVGLITEMNSSNFTTRDVRDLQDKMQESYKTYDFLGVKQFYEEIKRIYDAAYASEALIKEIREQIDSAEFNGIDVTDTKKLLYTAEAIFRRGDYLLALERLKEAKTVYALETKGEYNFLYDFKNNPIKFLAIFLSIGAFGATSTVALRYRFYKTKLRMLGEEEKLLLQLMKVVQTECFENKKISMGEYQEAMSQYEKRLAETIEERISTETKLINIMKLKGKKLALAQEKTRLVGSMKELQEDYLNEGKIETRIYENLLKSYSQRLAKVEEELVYMEAQEYLGKRGIKLK